MALLTLLAVLGLPIQSLAQSFEGWTYHLGGREDGGPLVLALHGGGGSGRQLQADSPIEAAARAAGARVVYPDGPGGRWSDGRWMVLGRADLAQRDDAGHLLRLVERLQQGQADPRLFVIGHSNGGGMALWLACTAPRQIAGMAIVGTKLLRDAPCPNPAPVPMTVFHGTADRLAPHDGRRARRHEARMGAILSSDDSLAELGRRNRCTGPTVSQRLPPLPLSGFVPVFDTVTGCAAMLRRITVEGGGHGFPGGASGPLRDLLGGPPIPDLDAAAEAMTAWGLLPARR